jgi:uncharacterized protein YrrD
MANNREVHHTCSAMFFQVKELGLLTTNCSCPANDMSKIFDIYWMLATPSSQIPTHWPDSLDTEYNAGDVLDIYCMTSPFLKI